MKILDRHSWELLRHTATTFLVVLVMSGLAIGLDFLQRWCASVGVSAWLVFGIELMAKITFVFDGALFVATMGMFGAHFAREYYYRLFRS